MGTYHQYKVEVWNTDGRITEQWRDAATGLLHRVEGPAILTATGYQYYKQGQLHRYDGPAWKDGEQEYWYQYGLLHNINGPAWVIPSRNEYRYYINGCQYSMEGWKAWVFAFKHAFKQAIPTTTPLVEEQTNDLNGAKFTLLGRSYQLTKEQPAVKFTAEELEAFYQDE